MLECSGTKLTKQRKQKAGSSLAGCLLAHLSVPLVVGSWRVGIVVSLLSMDWVRYAGFSSLAIESHFLTIGVDNVLQLLRTVNISPLIPIEIPTSSGR